MNTQMLLTELEAAHDGASGYRIAQLLGVKPQTVYRWKHGQAFMSDEAGIRAAELLGIDPVSVMIDLHLERDKGNATFPVWQAMRDRLKVACIPAMVGLAGYCGGAFVGVPLI